VVAVRPLVAEVQGVAGSEAEEEPGVAEVSEAAPHRQCKSRLPR